MKIILKSDVLNLGFANDVITVKDGYARNYLIPQGIAVLATDQNMKILTENLKQKAHKEEKIRTIAQNTADSLENIVVKIGAKVGASGKLFGSVNAVQIAEALKEQHNIEVDRKKIAFNGEHIKEVGEYTAVINLHRDVKGTIKFEVVAE
jgi:large subunit ribosomal protein L9